MPYENPKELLTAATALPARIEERLPEKAPKISTMLLDATEKMPDLPNFLIALPDLPAIPEFPEAPTGLRRFVTSAEVKPTPEPTPTTARRLGSEILS